MLSFAGVLYRRNAGLHRAGDLSAAGLWQRVRLLVAGGYHVRVSRRIPPILFGDHARDVPKDHQLGIPLGHPRRCPRQ